MKITMKMCNRVSLGLLLLTVAFSAQGFLLCEKNIQARSSPFQWQQVAPDVPMYLLPGDANQLYRSLLNRYLSNLPAVDASRAEVVKFIEAQEKIVAGQFNPLVDIGAGLDSADALLEIGSAEIELKCADIAMQYLIDIAHLAVTLEKIHDASYEVFRVNATARIQRLNLQYQNLFDNGLPMWPQETWLNGLGLDESDAEAPDTVQWVLLRPSIGLGLNADQGLDDGDLEETLGVELGGFVRYMNDDFSEYWGLSVLATLGDDAGPGYGVLLRYNNFILGFSQRDRDIAAGISEDTDYYYIGLDLYDLIMEKDKRFRDYKEKVRNKISELKQ